MKYGKEHIYRQPVNDLTEMGPYAEHLQQEAALQGKERPALLRLNLGEPGFRTPEHIRQAACESLLHEMQTYGAAAGHPHLRQLLVEKVARINGYQIQPENVAVTLGGTGAIQAALQAIVGPGDEVLLPDPGWATYSMQLLTCGASAVPYPLDALNEWLPDLTRMEKLVTPRTRVLLINTPGNPTGAVFPRELIAELLAFARKHDLYLLSDECYDQIIFEGSHISPATMLTADELESGHFIGIYTFSKTYAMTGWRIGYVVAGTSLMKSIIDVLNGSHSSINIAIQRAAMTALTGPQHCVDEMRESYQHNRDLAVTLLQDYGRYVYTPHGAFYALIDIKNSKEKRESRQFTFDLLRERNVVVAPGSAFGQVAAKRYIRISLAASAQEIKAGVREICSFADR